MIRCVAFDFDGTLVDSNEIKRQTFFHLASEFEGGIQLMELVLGKAAEKNRYWIYREFASALPVTVDATALSERYTRTCQERIASAPEIAGAESILDKLKAEKKKLFVNSATPKEPLIELVSLRRLDRFFDGVYGSPAKKQENLETIRNKYGFALEDMLVVGDGESDRAAAEITGCHFIAVKSDNNDFLREPTYIVSNLAHLPDIISSIS